MNDNIMRLKCLYRINLLTARGEEMNHGIIQKLRRKLRKLHVAE